MSVAESTYEIVVPHEPDMEGWYTARVTKDGAHVFGSSTSSQDRDEAIEKARTFAEWHRTYSDTRETIPV